MTLRVLRDESGPTGHERVSRRRARADHPAATRRHHTSREGRPLSTPSIDSIRDDPEHAAYLIRRANNATYEAQRKLEDFENIFAAFDYLRSAGNAPAEFSPQWRARAEKAEAALAAVRDAWWSGVVQGDNEYQYTDPDKTMDAIWIALGDYGTPDQQSRTTEGGASCAER